MTTAVIVQARTGSKRLPGKVLEKLAGRTVLEHVLTRALAIPGGDMVVCAVPESDAGVLGPIATKLGCRLYAGPEHDVLARYYGAAKSVRADIIMRITADCPLIDPEVCAEVLALCQPTAYAANVIPRTFPHGLDCEAFTADALILAYRRATSPLDREHVTRWMLRSPSVTRKNLSSGRPELAEKRWVLDWPEDLQFLEGVFAHGWPGGLDATLRILREHPQLEDINARRRV